MCWKTSSADSDVADIYQLDLFSARSGEDRADRRSWVEVDLSFLLAAHGHLGIVVALFLF